MVKGGTLCLVLCACGSSRTTLTSNEAGVPSSDGQVAWAADSSDATSVAHDAARVTESDSSEADEGAFDAAPWSPALHGCAYTTGFEQYPPPPPAGPAVTPCPGADLFGFTKMQVIGQDGGPVTAGTTATVSLVVTSGGIADAGQPGTCVAYPCLAISADNPGVSFSGGGPLLYCLSPGWVYSIDATFASTLTPGTRVRFSAWAIGSNGIAPDGSSDECNTPPVQWDLTLD